MSSSKNQADEIPTAETYENVFIARQPIFDETLATWGHMLLFRNSEDATRAVFEDEFEATLNVISNMYLCSGTWSEGSRLILHFSKQSLSRDLPRILPASQVVIRVDESVSGDANCLERIKSLKDEGYLIAVTDFLGDSANDYLYSLADMLIIDLCERNQDEITAIASRVSRYKATLMAKRVENLEAVESAKRAGCSLFQGFFFKEPKNIAGRKVSSTDATRLKLFDIIERDEPDFEALIPAVEADVAISFRLLTFLNSASFSFATKVTSIRQAVVLAGWKTLRNWLRLIILTDISPAEKTRELVYFSALRAKFFENLALAGGHAKEADNLFMLGLFSLLDAIFDLPMKVILKNLPLEDEFKDALAGLENHYAPWLLLTKSIEESDWALVGTLASLLGISSKKTLSAHQNAQIWTDSFFGNLGQEKKPEETEQ